MHCKFDLKRESQPCLFQLLHLVFQLLFAHWKVDLFIAVMSLHIRFMDKQVRVFRQMWQQVSKLGEFRGQ